MKRWLSLLIILIAITLQAQQTDVKPNRAAPVILPNVSPEMRSPGYWISRHPTPDRLVMDAQAIERFNSRIRRERGTVTAIWEHSTAISGRTIRTQINNLHNYVKGMRLHDAEGNRVTPEYWQELFRLENPAAIPSSIRVRFALASAFAHQRLAPSLANLNITPLDTDFDELQNSGYDIGSPIVLYHNSRDGNWAFGATSTTSGWFRLQDLSIVSREDWRNFQRSTDRVVCLSAKSDIWLDEAATRFHGSVRMGMSFPYQGETDSYYIVKMPVRTSDGASGLQNAYIAKSDARRGFLPYTVRNVYTQAFKMLNHSYGWGDMRGDWDCSSMLIHIYSCFGIRLPRNGLSQAVAGKLKHEFRGTEADSTKYATLLSKATGGVSMLQMKGHIMLYLGEVNGIPYAIHNTSGFRSPAPDNMNYVHSINRTVVSDLELGRGSIKTSLIERILRISDISE